MYSHETNKKHLFGDEWQQSKAQARRRTQTEHLQERQIQTERQIVVSDLSKAVSHQTSIRGRFHAKQQMLPLSSLHQKRTPCVCRSQFSTAELCQAAITSKGKLLSAFCFIPWHSLLCQGGEGPASCTQAPQPTPSSFPVSMLLTSLERREMKQSRLIETESTPYLCELPFSWLRTLTVGNYSAGEHQSLQLMCIHRLEPDIKGNLTIWFTYASL